MDIEVKAWLYDILNAIHEIESFFADADIAEKLCAWVASLI